MQVLNLAYLYLRLMHDVVRLLDCKDRFSNLHKLAGIQLFGQIDHMLAAIHCVVAPYAFQVPRPEVKVFVLRNEVKHDLRVLGSLEHRLSHAFNIVD